MLEGLRTQAGQVVVEMLLILPVFLTIVFSIMELGYLAFWVITINHATYEAARIGSLVATPRNGGAPNKNKADGEMGRVMRQAIRQGTIESVIEPTIYDFQADVMNHDLVVTGSHYVPLVFPISSILFASPKGSGKRLIQAVVRMPIEQPLKQGESTKGIGGKTGGKFKKG